MVLDRVLEQRFTVREVTTAAGREGWAVVDPQGNEIAVWLQKEAAERDAATLPCCIAMPLLVP